MSPTPPTRQPDELLPGWTGTRDAFNGTDRLRRVLGPETSPPPPSACGIWAGQLMLSFFLGASTYLLKVPVCSAGATPAGPVGPVEPVAPVAPTPAGPCAPAGPVGPVAPTPVGPMAPAGPVAPSLP